MGEGYSVVEYEPEEMQIVSEYQKNEQAEQIENMIEKYGGIWTCKACGKTASQKCNIKSHVETHHLNDFSHHCDICGKSCRSKNALMFTSQLITGAKLSSNRYFHNKI